MRPQPAVVGHEHDDASARRCPASELAFDPAHAVVHAFDHGRVGGVVLPVPAAAWPWYFSRIAGLACKGMCTA